MKYKFFYFSILIIILIYIFNLNYKYNHIIKPINTMMIEINYYYDAYKLYSENNKISIKQVNKKLKYKNIKIKSCTIYDLNKNINTLTQCIVDANKKNGVIKNTNKQANIYDKYYMHKKKNNSNEALILSNIYTSVYDLSMYTPKSFKDYKKYYNNTIKNINKNYQTLSIPQIYYLKGGK